MFGASTAARSMSANMLMTPPGVGPGRYEQDHFKIEAKPGESVAGYSAFLGAERACNKKIIARGPGPGSHRPETYTDMCRPRSHDAPMVETARRVRKPYLEAREEVRRRGTTPSIAAHTATAFSYEETDDGRLRPVDGAPNAVRPEPELPSPFSYTPVGLLLMASDCH